jgi:hypothetical protein
MLHPLRWAKSSRGWITPTFVSVAAIATGTGAFNIVPPLVMLLHIQHGKGKWKKGTGRCQTLM